MQEQTVFTLFSLAAGAFAIGADAFIMIGMLKEVAADLAVGPGAAGQLVTAFALCYAVFAPLGATVSGRLGGRNTLLLAMLLFSAGNALCALSGGYGAMLAGRVLAALGAASFIPVATATASGLVGPARRGAALSVIFGGMTVATAFGAPLGTWSGQTFGWRYAFALLAALLPRAMEAAAVPLSRWLAAARNGRVLATLAVTFCIVMSEYVVFSYIAVVLGQSLWGGVSILPAMMLVFGVGAILGNIVTGIATDRFGPARVLLVAVTAQGACMVLLVVFRLSPAVVLPAAFLWGVFSYMYLVPIQHRLLSLASEAGAFTVSLNSSVIYLAISAGSALGGLILAFADVPGLLAASLAALLPGLVLILRIFPFRREGA